MPAQERNTRLKNLATSLHQVVDGAILSKGGLSYTNEPTIIEKDIIEYDSRMRISAMEKFNAPCFISVINYYNSSEDMQKHRNSKGAIIIYLEEINATKFLKTIGYPIKMECDDDVVLEHLGQFTKSIADNFKEELAKAGYPNLVFSAAQGFKNLVLDGVEFDYNEFLKYELIYSLWKERILAVDFTLS